MLCESACNLQEALQQVTKTRQENTAHLDISHTHDGFNNTVFAAVSDHSHSTGHEGRAASFNLTLFTIGLHMVLLHQSTCS